MNVYLDDDNISQVVLHYHQRLNKLPILMSICIIDQIDFISNLPIFTQAPSQLHQEKIFKKIQIWEYDVISN